MFLQNYEKGYASEIAKTYGTSLNQIGILISRKEANARVFYFKQSPVTDALRVFLSSMLEHLPNDTVQKYYRDRRRPRRYGKR
jgi:hypothetical protein